MSNNLAKAQFIIAEAHRFALEIKQYGLGAIDKRDLACSLGSGRFLGSTCGREAMNALSEISRKEYDAKKEINSTVPESAFLSSVSKQFELFFIEEAREVNAKNVAKVFSSAFKILKNDFKKVTHFIPCYLFQDANPKEFNLGPVRFIHISIFSKEFGSSFDKLFREEKIQSDEISPITEQIYFSTKRKKEFPKVTKLRFLRLLAYRSHLQLLSLYKGSILSYNWIAIIPVSSCHRKLSDEIAEFTCEQALNVLRLMLNQPYNERLRLGLEPHAEAKSIRLFLEEEKPTYHFSSSAVENIQSNWHQYLWSNDGAQFITILESVLHGLVNLTGHSPLKERLYDALTWYGQAVSELSPGIAVVKYISAIERLILTGEHDKITETVCSRAACLIKFSWGDDEYEALSMAYSLRSKIVHGVKSPTSANINRELYRIATLTRKLILSVADFYRSIGLDIEITNKQLKGVYINFLESQTDKTSYVANWAI